MQHTQTNAEMRVDAGVSRGTRQVLVLPVRYVLVSLRVTVLLRQSKVDDVHQVALLPETHEEIVWLYIAMDEVLGVYVLNAAYLQQNQNSFPTTIANTIIKSNLIQHQDCLGYLQSTLLNQTVQYL